MGEISANPRTMELYAIDSENQLRPWKDDMDELRQVLVTLRNAMANVPADLQIWVPDYAQTFETLTAGLEHLDSVFVRNVAHDVAEADGVDFTTHWGYRDYPDVVVTVDEADVDPGPANRDEHLVESGQADAEDLLLILGELRDDEAFEREGILLWGSLLEDDETRDPAIALLDAIGSNMGEPAYLDAFYTTLGPEGARGLAGVLNDLALHYEVDGRTERGRALVDPVVDGFAAYTHLADEDYTDQLFTFDHSTANRDEQRLNLAILFSGDGGFYQPDHLATAAGMVLMQRNVGQNQADLADALVLGALAGNPQAASTFVDGLYGDGEWILTYAHRPYHEGATTTWLGTSDQDELLMLHNVLAAAAWAHSQGVGLDELDPESWQPEPYGDFNEYLSTMVGFVPGLGEVQAADEARHGYDRFTGDELSAGDRTLAGASVFFPFLPFRKIRNLLSRSDGGEPPLPPTGRPPGSTPDGVPDPEGPIVWTDPLERLTHTQLAEFRYRFGVSVTDNWVHPYDPASVDDLPYGHPLRNLSDEEFRELGDHVNEALAESLFSTERTTRGIDDHLADPPYIDSVTWDDVPGGEYLRGKSDWEIYALMKPILGDVQMPSGTYLPDPWLDPPVTWDPLPNSFGGPGWGDSFDPGGG